MPLKLKAVVECDGKTAPYYDTEPCPTDSRIEVEAVMTYIRGGIAFTPDLPGDWNSFDRDDTTLFECPDCYDVRRKED